MAGVSELELLVLNPASASPKSSPSKRTHVEAVRRLSELFSQRFKVVKTYPPWEAFTRRDLPEVLKDQVNLAGDEIICFRGPNTNTPRRLFIEKSFWDLESISPAFFYIRYYAHVPERDGLHGTKSLYVKPALDPDEDEDTVGEKMKSLPITDDFAWVEQVVELDMDTATDSGSHFNGFELGMSNFEETDLLVIERFGIVQGFRYPGLARIRRLLDSFQMVLSEPHNPETQPPQGDHQQGAVDAVIATPTFFQQISPPFLSFWRFLRNCFFCCRERNENDYEAV